MAVHRHTWRSAFQVYLGALPRLREQVPFRICGGITRWGKQLDGCRRTRAAGASSIPAKDEGELEPLSGGSSILSQKRIAAAYGGAVAFRSFTEALVLFL